MQLNDMEQNSLFALIKAYTTENFGADQIYELFENYLKPIFCYDSLIAGVGEVELTRVKIGKIISVNYPEEFLKQIEKVTSVEKRSLLAYWLEQQQPLFIHKGNFDHILSDMERMEIDKFYLCPMLIHGQRDLSGKFSSYFSFRQCNIDEEKAKYLLKIYMPYLHLILAKGLKWQYSQTYDVALKLTHREWQLVDFIKQGKSNKEIALSLQKSPSTIKNQTLQLFRKLEVSTRSEVLSKIQILSSSRIDDEIDDI